MYSHWIGSTLVQIMACRLFGAKPLSKPILAYCKLESWGHISVKFESELYDFHSLKCNWKYRQPKWRPFCPGGDEFNEFIWLLSCLSEHGNVDKYGTYILFQRHLQLHCKFAFCRVIMWKNYLALFMPLTSMDAYVNMAIMQYHSR